MRRAFTTREKILLLILVVMIIALGYFKLILEPINDQIAEYNSLQQQEQILIDQQRIMLAKMRKMEKLLEEMKASGNYQSIPSYDNKNAVIVELHSVLAAADAYSLDFDETTTMDYILARPVMMEFTVPDYESGRSIIDQLNESENFNLISDIALDWDEEDGVTISMRITYYEVIMD